MTHLELFKRQLTGDWTTSGNSVQWRVTQLDDYSGRRHILIEFQSTAGDLRGADWKRNLQFWPVRARFLKDKPWVHKGFAESFQEVQSLLLGELCGQLGQATQDKKKLVVRLSGYSLGGALAVLAGAYLEEAFTLSSDGNIPEFWVYTFACPRMFFGKVRQEPHAILPRHMIVRGDLFSMLPPAWLGYSRGGQALTFYCGPRSLPSPWKHEPSEYLKHLKDYKLW